MSVLAAAAGAGISAAGSLIGGVISGNQSAKAQAIANQASFDLAHFNRDLVRSEAKLGRQFASAEARKQRDFQSRQAELERFRSDTSISRLVDDARAAGIHPLAALGGGGAQYAPILQQGAQGIAPGASGPPGVNVAQPAGGPFLGDSIGEAFALMGNVVNRIGELESEKREGELVDSQIDRNKAEAAALVAEARSRTDLARLREGTRGSLESHKSRPRAPASSVGGTGDRMSDRPTDVEPFKDVPFWKVVSTGDGRKATGINEEAMESEAAQMLSDFGIFGQLTSQWIARKASELYDRGTDKVLEMIK